jgi:ankyrin repeat protein
MPFGGVEQERSRRRRHADQCRRVDVNARDSAGRTCCHAAATVRNAVALRCFINAGADFDVATESGSCTPLHDAVCDPGTGDCATLLLAVGANVYHRDSGGYTVCHNAVLFRADLPLCAVLAAGGDFDAINNSGDSARQFALNWGMKEPTSDKLAVARRKIERTALSLVRWRAFEICIALHPLGLDALRTVEILRCSCGPAAPQVPFHVAWWQLATTIKHFHK